MRQEKPNEDPILNIYKRYYIWQICQEIYGILSS